MKHDRVFLIGFNFLARFFGVAAAFGFNSRSEPVALPHDPHGSQSKIRGFYPALETLDSRHNFCLRSGPPAIEYGKVIKHRSLVMEHSRSK
jgi:hypothetical protein